MFVALKGWHYILCLEKENKDCGVVSKLIWGKEDALAKSKGMAKHGVGEEGGMGCNRDWSPVGQKPACTEERLRGVWKWGAAKRLDCGLYTPTKLLRG